MNTDEKKKVLFVMGLEQGPERILNQMSGLTPDHILVMQTYGAVIEPFGDLMRDIILAVNRDNVEEIFVAAPEVDQKNVKETLKKMYANQELQEKIQTLDYLFKNCKPEYQNTSIREWLEGGKTSANSKQTNAEVIRNHPLLPSNVKVTEVMMESEDQSKMAKLI
ncbi:hypothetical protein [Neobacillus niacini]|uniref:hypothetical protein n=1 Tax=Neobacillus niacini TaxID=86668 RepID=UPI0021CAFD27|nr:hypothetical protein [Neobacillus niacini]MCM3766120.1 hypothetical protein [Neobacillus niacini]